MSQISYEQIIAVLGLCVWFIFPFGMFISAIKQDREALPPPSDKTQTGDEHLKIFGHKKMLYNEESEENDIPEGEGFSGVPYIAEEPTVDEDFIHPHEGIGATHSHHIHLDV